MSPLAFLRSESAVRSTGTEKAVAVVVATMLSMLMTGCLSGSTSTTTTIAKLPLAKIELGLYSGRPDPSWLLSARETASLGKMLAQLHQVPGTPIQGGLGYHGFTIIERNRTLVAFRGEVAPLGDSQNYHLADERRTIERFLLQSGLVNLSASEFVFVEHELGMIR